METPILELKEERRKRLQRESSKRYRDSHVVKRSAYSLAYYHRKKNSGDTSIAWKYYKANSKRRGYEFSLDRLLFDDHLTDYCFYCGTVPKPLNGIDRVDNSKGYVIGNTVTACKQCNYAKHDYSRAEFERWATRVADRAKLCPADLGT